MIQALSVIASCVNILVQLWIVVYGHHTSRSLECDKLLVSEKLKAFQTVISLSFELSAPLSVENIIDLRSAEAAVLLLCSEATATLVKRYSRELILGSASPETHNAVLFAFRHELTDMKIHK